MFFLVIAAFALVLSDGLPPERLNLLGGPPWTEGRPLVGVLAVITAQTLVVLLAAMISSRLTSARLDGTAKGQDQAMNVYTRCQHVLLGIIATALVGTLILTPWAPLVREGWHLQRVPLIGDLLILAPFFAALTIIWSVFYRVDLRIRQAATALAGEGEAEQSTAQENEATTALATAKRRSPAIDSSLATYLLDKFRHQVLIIAVPMSLIVFAKYFTNLLKPDPARSAPPDWINRFGPAESVSSFFSRLPEAADGVLGAASVCILILAPVMLRYIWATDPLPAGPLRDRFVRTCGRIGLRYREILLWHTHGTAINAAVMGFVAPLRYILVSDALLETMDEAEIEAVFGHEAGHVRHWHLPFFALFALVSMYLAGGVMILLSICGRRWQVEILQEPDLLQLVALAVLLGSWLFGFGWLSRRFERQADLFGVRCIAPDITSCTPWCPVHGQSKSQNVEKSRSQDVEESESQNVETAVHQDGGIHKGQSSISTRSPNVPGTVIVGSPATNGGGLCSNAASLFGRTLEKIADLNGIPRDAPSWRHGSIDDRRRLIERLASDAMAMKRFDRHILLVKIGLVVASVVGTIAAAAVYYPLVGRALGWG